MIIIKSSNFIKGCGIFPFFFSRINFIPIQKTLVVAKLGLIFFLNIIQPCWDDYIFKHVQQCNIHPKSVKYTWVLREASAKAPTRPSSKLYAIISPAKTSTRKHWDVSIWVGGKIFWTVVTGNMKNSLCRNHYCRRLG